ncbi:hypothetical protein B0J13DRAFT_623396 [Dactylonectria estremocensis]|uniref:Uncharacterized protein n=1 Tax=Dactylonectria estremocensis TaxID=1079267 RepID=A0A9P9J642_9HYPO|nr:hypothetical protein B0J13DRAFT_623396 [Dactylonectria estremocensis]
MPSQVYKRLERNEPSTQEKARTEQLVPPTERGLEDERSMDIREFRETLGQGHDLEVSGDVAMESGDADGEDGDGDGDLDSAPAPVHEISSSETFALNGRPDVADAEKLQYVRDALGRHDSCDGTGGSTLAGSAEVRRGYASEPYILVPRGEDFADPFEPLFFTKTFPTLFPVLEVVKGIVLCIALTNF